MCGLKSKKGNPIKKPWRIVTSSQTLVDSLSPHVCVHKASDHDICQGAETLKSGFYPHSLARKIVLGLCPPSLSKPVAKTKAHLVIPATVGSPGYDQDAVAECRHEELKGLESSGGGASSKIMETAMRQLDKLVSKTEAKFRTLRNSTDKLQAYNLSLINN